MCGLKTDVAFYPEVFEKLKALEQDHLVQIEERHVTVTPEGWPFARIAAACFDTYYQPQEGQHARAI
jgi:oxygen-independent coproporphyrinogen-3 oxidase